jgi:hypothetical protein
MKTIGERRTVDYNGPYLNYFHVNEALNLNN